MFRFAHFNNNHMKSVPMWDIECLPKKVHISWGDNLLLTRLRTVSIFIALKKKLIFFGK